MQAINFWRTDALNRQLPLEQRLKNAGENVFCATWRAVHLFPQMLKMDFQRDRWKSIFARWGRTPNPVNSPVAGAGCAFVSQTLLFLLRRKRRSLRALAKWKSGNSNSCHHHRIAARQARDCLDNSQISSRRFCKSSMSAA